MKTPDQQAAELATREGWTYLYNSPKWHYFRNHRSLCGRFMLLATPEEGFEADKHDHHKNCVGCRRKIEKEIAKAHAAH